MKNIKTSHLQIFFLVWWKESEKKVICRKKKQLGPPSIQQKYSRTKLTPRSSALYFVEFWPGARTWRNTWRGTRVPKFVLANEETLLRTHYCSWCFLGCANWGTFVADTKFFWTKSETIFVSLTQNLCPQQMLRRGQTGKHLCRQQCVRNNVSSFARVLTNSVRTRGAQ